VTSTCGARDIARHDHLVTTGPTRRAPPHAAPDLRVTTHCSSPATPPSVWANWASHEEPTSGSIDLPIKTTCRVRRSLRRRPPLSPNRSTPPSLPPISPQLHLFPMAPLPCAPTPRCSEGLPAPTPAAPVRCRLRAHHRAAMIAMFVHSTAYSSVTTTRASLLMQDVS